MEEQQPKLPSQDSYLIKSSEFFYKCLSYCIIFAPLIFIFYLPCSGILGDKKYEKFRRSDEYKNMELKITTEYTNYMELIKVLSKSSSNAEYSVTLKQNNYKTNKQNGLEDSYDAFVHNCSASVVQATSNNPFAYLCKYFNIEYTNETIEILTKLPQLTKSRLAHLYQTSFNKLRQTDCLFKRANYIATFIFYYESPQGNSNSSCEIVLTPENIMGLKAHIQAEIEHKQSKEQQRSLMTNELRTAIKQRDNYTCCNCGNSTLNEPNLLLEVDHIIPISKGGQTEYYNLQTLCWRCNRSKSDKVY